ncbi:MAG: L-2-hydroxyglutarate oxidase [Planctomycetaceae bacterium]|nr:L-2-hydroxyglutarate oxidase [Planctomycetaceae bacterium]
MASASSRRDVVVLGGGIVGLATAWQLLQQRPGIRVTLLEKEASLAFHQTGRNSGVIHSGIYYKPGSLRALNCRIGKEMLEAFCTQHSIAWRRTGKIIAATDPAQLPALKTILDRGRRNGIECEHILRERLLEIEPHCSGIEGIHVPGAGIVDYPAVCEKLGELIRESGGQIVFNARVVRLESRTDSVIVEASNDAAVEADVAVNCCGLHSDRIARLSGQQFRERIVPFRGEYYELCPEAEYLCRGLIYPVPDPRFPFLGVHFTRMAHGGVECGPNAVLALAREGYSWGTINLRDLFESLTYPGFLRLAARNWKTGLGEVWRSLSKAAFVRALQKLVPDIRPEHLKPGPSGVRAQALGLDGRLVDDFMILRHERVINVCNAPSPAATASLNIGKSIAAQVLEAS